MVCIKPDFCFFKSWWRRTVECKKVLVKYRWWKSAFCFGIKSNHSHVSALHQSTYTKYAVFLLQVLSGGRVLVLTSAQISDTGKYTCVAVNAAGESQRDIDLRVYGEIFWQICWQWMRKTVRALVVQMFSNIEEKLFQAVMKAKEIRRCVCVYMYVSKK